MNPERFNWLPVPGADGVRRKFFGSFSERAFWIEQVGVEAGTRWSTTVDAGRRLIVVLSGTATVDDTKIGRLAALQVEAGEELNVDATEDTVLHIVGLPPVRLPAIPSDQFDIVTSDGAIQFENPRQAG
jgi:redox-sensitive bicupin YhaK (pirin superfamily)